MSYDPFDPGTSPTNCPACQKARSSGKPMAPIDETTRRCANCGRVERWMKPDRKVHGTRRYKRLVARQRLKFGDLDFVLAQWIADPDDRTYKAAGPPPSTAGPAP